MSKLKIGISIGDINGVGLEVILKALSNEKIRNFCTPIIFGSSKVISYHKNIVGLDFHFQPIQSATRPNADKINVVNCWNENVNITLGKPSETSGEYAFRSLAAATEALKEKQIDGLVTAPINKAAMRMANFPLPGHTEYLTDAFKISESLMFMVSDQLRIGLVTNHVPISDVSTLLTKERLIRKLQVMEESLRMDFGLERPTIAVLGLNPHASDNGAIGEEEDKIIRPAIVELKKKGMMIMGPFPADGFFGSAMYNKYDAVMAMYHDQGLIPFKALSFGEGINFTAGLPIVRTSPDHGTAYDIAGQNMADPRSFQKALFLALDLIRNRKDYLEMHENRLEKKELTSSSEEDLQKEQAFKEDEN